MVPESAVDSKWIGTDKAGWESSEARRHLMVTFSIRRGLHESHDCGSGVVINHHGNQQKPSKWRRQ